jgi:negative regulator of genetic competence, sporulation and motility
MTFETLNNNVMLVELSGIEMKKFQITYEMLDDNSEETQIAIKSLLSEIKTEKRFSMDEKVVVEALPTENGGCFFIFTFTHKRKRYKVKQNNKPFIFQADNVDDFLDFISAIKRNTQYSHICNAYKVKNNYYLHIPYNNKKITHFAMEYGEKTENICLEWLIEHGKNLGKIYLQ